MYFITALIIAGGVCTMLIYSWMQKNVLTDPKLFDQTQVKRRKEKLKMSLFQSFKCIFSSSYLGLILVLVLGYNICINLIEMVWKGQLRMAFPDKNDYANFMGTFSSITGLATVAFTILGMNILRRCKWRTAAIVNPVIILITGTIFFFLLNYLRINGPQTPVNLGIITTTLVVLTVWVGLVQNISCKSTKYSLFDSTKQMAYIPLDSELKAKGQAAVEVIGGRFGKSGGSLIQAALLSIVGGSATLISLTPILGPIVICIAVVWIFAVFGLHKKFTALSGDGDAKPSK
jgi:AAA family ATP:ADP antiporter